MGCCFHGREPGADLCPARLVPPWGTRKCTRGPRARSDAREQRLAERPAGIAGTFGVATLRVGPDELQRLGPAQPPGGHHLAAEVEPVPHAAPQVVHRVGPQLEPAVEGELVAGTDDATLGDGP